MLRLGEVLLLHHAARAVLGDDHADLGRVRLGSAAARADLTRRRRGRRRELARRRAGRGAGEHLELADWPGASVVVVAAAVVVGGLPSPGALVFAELEHPASDERQHGETRHCRGGVDLRPLHRDPLLSTTRAAAVSLRRVGTRERYAPSLPRFRESRRRPPARGLWRAAASKASSADRYRKTANRRRSRTRRRVQNPSVSAKMICQTEAINEIAARSRSRRPASRSRRGSTTCTRAPTCTRTGRSCCR